MTALAQSPELGLRYRMEPGDLVIFNNLSMLHAKTAFKVGPSRPIGRYRHTTFETDTLVRHTVAV
jgi:alpha-ketoglutarate-dependent taurine dioxygenase